MWKIDSSSRMVARDPIAKQQIYEGYVVTDDDFRREKK